MESQRIYEICASNRQTGSSTWILFSAVRLPNCILVFHNERHARDMEDKYIEILRRVGLSRDDPRRGYPIFTTVNSQLFRGGGYGRLPIIFDNSCFF